VAGKNGRDGYKDKFALENESQERIINDGAFDGKEGVFITKTVNVQ